MAHTVHPEAHAIALDRAPCTPWRNGGGVTRELLAWPHPSDWRLRISVADIGADGPFSAFAGVRRWFALLSGDGVVLDFGGQPHALRLGDAPLAFDGAQAPGCRLLGGPVRDLNLMCRGADGGMAPAAPGQPWRPPTGAQAGLFARVAGRWRSDDLQHHLPGPGLLWLAQPPGGDWVFEPDTHAPAEPDAPTAPIGWWLHFLPTDIHP